MMDALFVSAYLRVVMIVVLFLPKKVDQSQAINHSFPSDLFLSTDIVY
jgi:hypothetical protein